MREGSAVASQVLVWSNTYVVSHNNIFILNKLVAFNTSVG